MAEPDHIACLRAIPLFSELDEAALERIAAIATEVEFPERALLIERNQPGSGMFVLLDGTASVELPHRTVELGPGQFIGELSLLTDGDRRTARVSAATTLRCLAIARPEFAELLESEPRIAVPMLAALAGRLAEMIRASE